MVAFGPVHPKTVTVTEYVPAIAAVADGRVGSSSADTNALGPVQEYVPPATVFAKRSIVVPAHTGVLLEIINAVGVGFTTTVVVLTALVHPATVVVKEYVPDANNVTAAIVGFCKADENAFGPVQEYVAPTTAAVLKFNVVPVQTGLLLLGLGVAGIGFTTTTIVPVGPAQPPTEAVTLYVPAANNVAPAIEGFCIAEVKPFGPVQE